MSIWIKGMTNSQPPSKGGGVPNPTVSTALIVCFKCRCITSTLYTVDRRMVKG